MDEEEGPQRPGVDSEASIRLAAEFDPRLADVWLFMFGSDEELAEQGGERLGWFLRMAYLRGYEDALTEPRPGDLYRRLGIKAASSRKRHKEADVDHRPGGRR